MLIGIRNAMMVGKKTPYSYVRYLDTNYREQSDSAIPCAAFAITGLSGLIASRTVVSTSCVCRVSTGWDFLFACELNDNESGNFKMRVNRVSDTSLKWASSGNDNTGVSLLLDTAYDIVFDGPNRTITQNGTTYTISSSLPSTTSGRPFAICGADLVLHSSYWWRGGRPWKGLIGRTKVWTDGALVGDFCPAVKNDTREVGFHDVVSNNFYSTAYPDVPFLAVST